ncbi:hypothetical protein F4780DRAFT_625394 [Xylariomycetidae sp. FL0641]|nr:hypothetical protein F4780DRAFT_625394 [Xylariomycetidae sp. FL0641]
MTIPNILSIDGLCNPALHILGGSHLLHESYRASIRREEMRSQRPLSNLIDNGEVLQLQSPIGARLESNTRSRRRHSEASRSAESLLLNLPIELLCEIVYWGLRLLHDRRVGVITAELMNHPGHYERHKPLTKLLLTTRVLGLAIERRYKPFFNEGYQRRLYNKWYFDKNPPTQRAIARPRFVWVYTVRDIFAFNVLPAPYQRFNDGYGFGFLFSAGIDVANAVQRLAK